MRYVADATSSGAVTTEGNNIMSVSIESDRNPISGSRLGFGRGSRAVVLGVLFWLIGALVIRYGAQSGALLGPGRIVFFLLTIPLMAGAVAVVRRRGAARSVEMVAIATATAALCDVLALTWFPQIYAAEAASVLSGSVLLFWGILWALALACWRARSEV